MSSRDVLGWIVSTFLEKQLFCFKNYEEKNEKQKIILKRLAITEAEEI